MHRINHDLPIGPQPAADFYQLAETMLAGGASFCDVRARLLTEGATSFAVELLRPSLLNRLRRRTGEPLLGAGTFAHRIMSATGR